MDVVLAHKWAEPFKDNQPQFFGVMNDLGALLDPGYGFRPLAQRLLDPNGRYIPRDMEVMFFRPGVEREGSKVYNSFFGLKKQIEQPEIDLIAVMAPDFKSLLPKADPISPNQYFVLPGVSLGDYESYDPANNYQGFNPQTRLITEIGIYPAHEYDAKLLGRDEYLPMGNDPTRVIMRVCFESLDALNRRDAITNKNISVSPQLLRVQQAWRGVLPEEPKTPKAGILGRFRRQADLSVVE